MIRLVPRERLRVKFHMDVSSNWFVTKTGKTRELWSWKPPSGLRFDYACWCTTKSEPNPNPASDTSETQFELYIDYGIPVPRGAVLKGLSLPGGLVVGIGWSCREEARTAVLSRRSSYSQSTVVQETGYWIPNRVPPPPSGKPPQFTTISGHTRAMVDRLSSESGACGERREEGSEERCQSTGEEKEASVGFPKGKPDVTVRIETPKHWYKFFIYSDNCAPGHIEAGFTYDESETFHCRVPKRPRNPVSKTLDDMPPPVTRGTGKQLEPIPEASMEGSPPTSPGPVHMLKPIRILRPRVAL